MPDKERQVFQTNDAKRYKVTQWTMRLIGSILVFIVIVVGTAVVRGKNPSMPQMNSIRKSFESRINPDSKFTLATPLNKKFKGFKDFLQKKILAEKAKTNLVNTALIRGAFYVPWSPLSFDDLRTNGDKLNTIYPELHKILKKNSKYAVHATALFFGALGLMSIAFIHSKYLLLVSFIFIGIAWSSISTTKYLLVGEMAPDEESEKYYSVFNFSTVIPQAIAAFFLAFVTKTYFKGNMMETLFLGGAFMLIGAGISLLIYFKESQINPKVNG